MLFSYRPALLLQLASLVAAVKLPEGYKPSRQNKDVVPGAYIVTFESELPSAAKFYQNLTANGIPATTRRTFDQAIFPGTSFHLHDANDTHLDIIGNFTQVKTITPVKLHSLTGPVGDEANIAKLWSAAKLKGREAVKSKDQTSHKMTGVDKLQAEGFDGSGVVIGIVDSGIEYTLPALGGGFGPGFKVSHGHDFVGTYDDAGNNTPDDDVLDCNGHGTHVAGIIAASNDPYVVGVAPNATLYSYKVTGCGDGAADDDLIAAFIMAHKDGVDFISCSIGGTNSWQESPFSAAAAAIVALGTPCILAAGNDGSEGLFFTDEAATGSGVTAVGSVDTTNTPFVLTTANYIVDAGEPVELVYSLEFGNFSDISLPIVATSLDITNSADACEPITANLNGTIALIRRGTCAFDDKMTNAFAAGALYVLFYNNVPGMIDVEYDSSDLLGGASLSGVTGQDIIEQIAAGHRVEAVFAKDAGVKIDTPGPVNLLSAYTMSHYSSFGLTAENNIKPTVSAPGAHILSTYLSSQGGYAVLSGTSMATPFISGVVALYIQAKGKGISPKAINSALTSTAKPLNYNDGSKNATFLASVAQQGAGLVDAYQMVHGGIIISEPNLALNDTANFVKTPSFVVQNSGNESMTYVLHHQAAGTTYAFNSSYGPPDQWSLVSVPPIDEKYSSVVISPSTLTLAPGAKKRINISVKPDGSLNSTLLPIYSGFIKVTSSSGEVAGIPYAGLAANTKDIPMADRRLNLYQAVDPVGTIPYSGPGSLDGSIDSFLPANDSVPVFLWMNTFPTKEARMDIVNLNGSNPVRVAGLATVGSMVGFPDAYVGRGEAATTFITSFYGLLSDYTLVESGIYKMVLRLAKGLSDTSKAQGYETWETPPFYMNMTGFS